MPCRSQVAYKAIIGITRTYVRMITIIVRTYVRTVIDVIHISIMTTMASCGIAAALAVVAASVCMITLPAIRNIYHLMNVYKHSYSVPPFMKLGGHPDAETSGNTILVRAHRRVGAWSQLCTVP
jgi:hypothetical protein